MSINKSRPRVALLNFAQEDRTRMLASKLDLPLLESREDRFNFFLYYQEDSLTIEARVDGGFTELNVDFGQPRLLDRLLAGEHSDDPLIRAMGKGVDAGDTTVFDGTLGFAVDALHLAASGFLVTGAERNPIIRELTKDGLRRAKSESALHGALERFTIVEDSSIKVLEAMGPESAPDIIYLDPMYPELKRSVKRRKALEFLRDLVGDDPDAGELFRLSWERARRRVVVKRPLKGEELGKNPNHVLRGKSHRFDVYVKY